MGACHQESDRLMRRRVMYEQTHLEKSYFYTQESMMKQKSAIVPQQCLLRETIQKLDVQTFCHRRDY